MSRNTVLQLIAAVITIAILAVLHKTLGWLLDMTSTDFMVGVMVGAAAVFLVWYWAEREERINSRSGGSRSTAEQQSPRHSIDL
ncbi:hypothetical protein EJ078_00050 [Mesorhizobium sp. M1A.F.Ca.IN.022.06.1.1]|uniref:hypothetical protein n=1 Tax=Mesorhizobium sp. M1A.F.Ca.IN.022.06.1.1 TaxID=2493680 RepID=UPI000F74D402|nr:hypothetical protein [Mesorhizobium sp. M1A.F.Ca.IN.022.06.1.1]AZO57885.1 hypothetical protein EJ078_00050 [Mesorhizobium sp. M1A.F.Ca.IN.022.06.1.1]